ncbi:acyl-CoA N-acyltransferase [Mycena galopus ATCC 62051]|nr:acyl-CoA N-acyltransferase [Mycena galopus ATCC 62051]
MPVPDTLPSQSGRIVLVSPREEYDSAVAALRSHPETLRHLGFLRGHVSTVEEARAHRIARAADDTWVSFHIHLTTTGAESESTDGSGAFGGTVALSHIDTQFNSCEVGILVSPAYFRGGLATDALYTILVYAFETRKFHRVEFVTAVGNIGMRGWLDKAGVTLEGTKRDGWTDGNGGYTDVCLYSILEREWTETVKSRLEVRLNRVQRAS